MKKNITINQKQDTLVVNSKGAWVPVSAQFKRKQYKLLCKEFDIAYLG